MRTASLLLGTALCAGGLGAADSQPAERFDTVVLDPGHGGDDHGARSDGGLLEKDLVLEVARALQRRLRQQSLRVVMTREDDRYVALEERSAIANDARGDLFLSIHANAASSTRIRGVETFFLSLEATDAAADRVATRENAAFRGRALAAAATADPLVAILGDLIVTEHLRESGEFARLAQSELAKIGGDRSRGVKQAPFVVLSGVQMPASLVEIGFITNPGDARKLRSPHGRKAVVDALARAVRRFGRLFDQRRGIATGDASAAASDGGDPRW